MTSAAKGITLNIVLGVAAGCLITLLVRAYLRRQQAELDAQLAAVRERNNENRASKFARLIKLAPGPFSDPEDSDLGVYLRDLHLARVIVNTRERQVVAFFDSGWGYVHDDESDTTTMFPKPQEGVEPSGVFLQGFTLGSYFPTIPEEAFSAYADALLVWYHRRTPLMVCIAPGHMASVLEEGDLTHWLPFPVQ
jgi:hypothetical protein